MSARLRVVCGSKRFQLWTSFILFTLAQIATNIFNKISINQYTTKLAFFQAQFMNVLYVILGVVLMVFMQAYNFITPEERPWRYHLWYFITGVLDAISVFAMALGGFSTPGDWQTVLQQLTFPLTFVLAPLVFTTTRAAMKNSPRGKFIATCGAIVLLVGILVTILPSISSGDSGADNYSVTAVITFASANVFSTVSFLIKEWLLRPDSSANTGGVGASAVHLNVWNAIYMVPVTFLLWPLQSINIYGGIALADLPTLLWEGCRCFAGYSSDPVNAPSQCEGAWWSELIFSLGTFFAGCFAIVLVKEGSAAFQWAANVFAVPMSNIIFGLSFMPASIYQAYTWYIVVGFCLVSLGIVVYSMGEDKIKKDAKNQILLLDEEEHFIIPDDKNDGDPLVDVCQV